MSLERESPINLPVRTSARYDLLSASGGFLLLGGWALLVNRAAMKAGVIGTPPWVSALTQGAATFLITLVMVRAVAWLYHRMSHFRSGLDLILPAAVIVLGSGICLASVHALVGTRSIFQTIAPGLGIALVFNIVTATKLRRARLEGGGYV